jgi:hypothetical protein
VKPTVNVANTASTSKTGFATFRGLLHGTGGLLATLALLGLASVLLPAGASALTNPERHYEMVSPIYKGGYGVTNTFEPGIDAVAADGESVAFFSPGVFAGAPAGVEAVDYLARRGASGWSTSPLMPPASLQSQPEASDVSPSLGTVLKLDFPGTSLENSLPYEQFLLHQTDQPDTPANWEPTGTIEPLINKPLSVTITSASTDFCHVLLETDNEYPLVQEAVGASGTEIHYLYQFNRGCSGEHDSLALVGLNNQNKLIDPACYSTLGGETYETTGVPNYFNAVAENGSEVFFTVCTKLVPGEVKGSAIPHQVFVRLDGAKTLEVSRPRELCEKEGIANEVPCEGAAARPSAEFQGASSDGSKVYFTTSASLVPGDTDTSNNLYMASIGCPPGNPTCAASEREVTGMTQVSKDPTPGQAANVMGVTRIAPDGTRAYFVASGDLLTAAQTAALEDESRPAPHVGAANLYAYNSTTGGLSFIGDLCSAANRSGTVEDASCPSASGNDAGLWTNQRAEAQTAGLDGRFLVFATYAQLTASDSNEAADVYRYDAASGQLLRISGGENGFDATGNRTVLNGEGKAIGASIAEGHLGGPLRIQNEMNNRAISEDGSRIVFSSAAPLSPAATNGQLNAYEWHEGPGEGSVSLISSGGSPDPVPQVIISPSGNDIFFTTTDDLVPGDTDGAYDIYDARLGAGFPTPPAEPQPCSGDACQGPLTNPAPLLVPGSVSQAPGENLAPPAAAPPAKPAAPKPVAKTAKCRKGHLRRKGKCVKAKAAKTHAKKGRR